jgi:hypothetical protein
MEEWYPLEQSRCLEMTRSLSAQPCESGLWYRRKENIRRGTKCIGNRKLRGRIRCKETENGEDGYETENEGKGSIKKQTMEKKL